jgi:hypothetical protein
MSRLKPLLITVALAMVAIAIVFRVPAIAKIVLPQSSS